MNKQEQYNIDEGLIIRHLQKGTDEQEELLIKNWLSKSPENREYFNQIKKIWTNSDTLNDFDSIDTQLDFKNVLEKINIKKNSYKKPESNRNKVLFRIAAAIILLLSVGTILFQTIFKTNYISIITGIQETKTIVLADGSKVYLNKNSKLIYPEEFKRKNRKVTLTGEAYFEIEKNPHKPFKISTSNNVVEVLGTSFNVNSQKQEVVVDVVSGVVAVYKNDDSDNKTILKKGERATIHGSIIRKSKSKNSNFLSWKTGILEFRNSKLDEVIPEIEKYYKKHFILQDTTINNLVITTTIDNQPIEDVLEEFVILFSMTYTIKNDTIWIGTTQQ